MGKWPVNVSLPEIDLVLLLGEEYQSPWLIELLWLTVIFELVYMGGRDSELCSLGRSASGIANHKVRQNG
jgi:hypothetical protein